MLTGIFVLYAIVAMSHGGFIVKSACTLVECVLTWLYW